MNKKVVFVLVCLLVAMDSVQLRLVSSSQTIYRRPITITEKSGSTLTDFQVLLKVDTASLISAGKMRSDCGDIRFEDSTGSNIPYWIESGANSAETKIWVKVPVIPASGSTIIDMCYGDLGASSESSGDKTFEFFDDFDDNSIDTNKWFVYRGTVVEQNQRVELSSGSSFATVSKLATPSIIQYHAAHVTDSTGDVYVWYGRSWPLPGATRYGIRKWSGDCWGDVGPHCIVIEEWDSSTIVRASAAHWPATNAMEQYMITVTDTTTTTFKNLDKDITVSHELTNPASETLINLATWFASAYFDDIFVRKYASQEPTAQIGDERACDLIVPDISWNPASPKEGDTVTFTITIRNDGTDDAHNFNLAYYIDGTKKGESAVPNLPAGQTTTRVFTWIAVGGSHTVKCFADSNNNIVESNENNNEREESLTVSGKPDLTVSSVSWTPFNPIEGDTVTFTVTIKNQGTADAGAFKVAYYIDGMKKGEWSLFSILAGKTVDKTFTWTAVEGAHAVKAFADSNYDVDEKVETNNEREETFQVGPKPKPDLIVSSISLSPASPVEDNTVTFTVVVENQGGADAGRFKVAYFIDGTQKGEWTIYSLSGGDTTSKTFTWTAVEGSHTVKAVADSNDDIVEEDETNNEREETFQVGPKPKPDLIVSSISLSPTSPEEGDRVTFTVTVKNQGNARATSFKVAYYIDGAKLGEWSILSLDAGDTTDKTFTWTAVEGAHAVKAFADSNYDVDEKVETNNEREETFQVGNQPPVAAFCCINGYDYLNNSVVFVYRFTCFDATESSDPDGAIAKYTWNFGDGNITTLTDPIAHHNYTGVGVYTVTLNVMDSQGLWDKVTVNVEAILLGNMNDDLEVNIVDIAIVAQAYGTKPGDENWNPIADLNNDKAINILDISIVALEFGKTAARRRVPITITERSGNTLTDFQVLLTIDTTSSISAGEMRLDCQNIRFTDSTGAEIPYWIESGCNSQETKIWIKVPYIPASENTTIYLECDDLSFVNPKNNPDETFLFFDDFEDGVYTDKWHVHSLGINVNESGGVISLTGGEHGGNEACILTITTLSAQGGIILEDRASATNYNVVLWFGKAVPGSNDGVQYAIQGNDYVIYCHGDNFGYSDREYAGPAIKDWMFYQGKLYSNIWSGGHGSTYGVWTRTDQIQLNQDAEPYSYHVILYSAENGELRVDWIRVRKYAPVEPTVHIAAS